MRTQYLRGGTYRHERQQSHFPLDRTNRQFRADRPSQLWMYDFTYGSTWPVVYRLYDRCVCPMDRWLAREPWR